MNGLSGYGDVALWQALGFAQDDEFVVVWRFYAGPSALGFVGGVTQPYGLGWDMAAPLALSKGKRRSRFVPPHHSTPAFAKSAKGRAPRIMVGLAKNGRVQVPIQRFFATLRMTAFGLDDGF